MQRPGSESQVSGSSPEIYVPGGLSGGSQGEGPGGPPESFTHLVVKDLERS